jgi:type 1 glutamine amidotransferase
MFDRTLRRGDTVLRRRELFQNMSAAAIGLGLSTFPRGLTQAAGAPRRRVLFFTRSQGYEHSVVTRTGGNLSFAEQILTDLGGQHGFDVTCTKDGSVFTAKELDAYDAFFFYTTGDLTLPAKDGSRPMSPEGKSAFLDAIAHGKGFLGAHAATDTFLTAGEDRYTAHGDKVDPYVAMIGAEFIHHDNQQKARMRVVDRKFPGFEKLGPSFELLEEWYSLKDFAPNLHVLLVQETTGMEGPHYKRAPYPATWARMHGKGRVFYTSMGHREDVWTNPIFQSMLLGGIAWTVRNVHADVTPNLAAAAPGYKELPADPAVKPNA